MRGGSMLFVGLLCGLALAASPSATRPVAPAKLDLRVDKDAWGGASRADVEAVIRSAGRELLRHDADPVPPLHVTRGGHITLFEREPGGVIVVKLNARDTYWAQYAFQFGHELCHVLCHFREQETGNKWFEESVCETASLFVLRRMAETWQTDPPYPNWKSFSPKLADYADERTRAARLPGGQTFAEWYAANADALSKTGEDRPRNCVVANVLLPLFEADPDRWAAVAHLNDDPPDHHETLAEYLQRWCNHVDSPEDRAFIRKIGRLFGAELTGD